MTWLYRFWVLLSLPDNIWETEQESKAGSIGEIVLMTVRIIVCNARKGISVFRLFPPRCAPPRRSLPMMYLQNLGEPFWQKKYDSICKCIAS
jgi:hypothetical protein